MSEIIIKIGSFMFYGGCIAVIGGVMLWAIGLMMEDLM